MTLHLMGTIFAVVGMGEQLNTDANASLDTGRSSLTATYDLPTTFVRSMVALTAQHRCLRQTLDTENFVPPIRPVHCTTNANKPSKQLASSARSCQASATGVDTKTTARVSTPQAKHARAILLNQVMSVCQTQALVANVALVQVVANAPIIIRRLHGAVHTGQGAPLLHVVATVCHRDVDCGLQCVSVVSRAATEGCYGLGQTDRWGTVLKVLSSIISVMYSTATGLGVSVASVDKA